MADILSDDIIDALTNEAGEAIHSLNLEQLFMQLSLQKQALTQLMASSNSLLTAEARGKRVSYILNKNVEGDSAFKEKKILYNAYKIIQEIRFRITGEELTYRLYVTTDASGEVAATAKYVDVGSTRLSEFLSFNNKEIAIAMGKVASEASSMDEPSSTIAREWFNQKYNMVMQRFKHPSGDTTSTFWQIDNPPPEFIYRKDNPNVHQVFTRGHIVEALDAVYRYYEGMGELEKVSDSDVLMSFGQELKYDSVSGFKGGDNGMVQIKANAARLMRYTTIMNAIDKVLKIYDKILTIKNGQINKTLRRSIKTMYSNSGANNTINEVTDKMIDDFVTQLLQQLQRKT